MDETKAVSLYLAVAHATSREKADQMRKPSPSPMVFMMGTDAKFPRGHMIVIQN